MKRNFKGRDLFNRLRNARKIGMEKLFVINPTSNHKINNNRYVSKWRALMLYLKGGKQ